MDRRKFIKNCIICTTGAACLWDKVSAKNSILPSNVQLEACTLCQLNCTYCWRNTTPDRIPLGYLKFEDFKEFIKLNPTVKFIELANQGEIFLNPDLDKIIKYANKKNITLRAYAGVNLNTLTDEMAELLVKENFGEMTISIDGASQETYSIYRRGGDFDKVIENIKKIQYYQTKYNDFEHPKMVWKFIPFGHNEHEIPKAKQMAKELGIPIRFDYNNALFYSRLKNVDFVEKETGLIYKDYDDITKHYHYFYKNQYDKYISAKSTFFMCTGIWDCTTIGFDGTFLGCCMAYYNKAPNVNAFQTSLQEIFENKEVKKIINAIAMKSSAEGTVCNNCDVYKFLKENNLKITKQDYDRIKKKVSKNYG